MVKHSYLELVLSRICYRLAGVEPVVGRVAVREPRTSDRFAMVEDLALLKGFKFDEKALKLLTRDLPKIAGYSTLPGKGQVLPKLSSETDAAVAPPDVEAGGCMRAFSRQVVSSEESRSTVWVRSPFFSTSLRILS